MTLVAKSSTDLGGPCPELGSQRRGRHLQRYSDLQERLVAGCIPIRWSAGDDLKSAEVLMISSNSGANEFVFPKGGWETDETVSEAAARETMEESGVRGVLEDPILGAYTFYSNKAMRDGAQGRCLAYMFAMRVEEVLDVWPEQGRRNRVWVPVSEACSKCKYGWMREAVTAWMTRHGWQGSVPKSCQGSSTNGNSPSQCPQPKIAASM